MVGAGRVLIDTGFFIALFNGRDQHHASSRQMEEWLDTIPILLPWPILYETMNTRLVRRPESLARFGAFTRSTEMMLLDDTLYREESLSALLSPNSAKGSLSLVDAVLCSIIEDVNVPISAMLTFNERDFLTVCAQNNVELISVV